MPQVRATKPYSRIVSGEVVVEMRQGSTHYFTPAEWSALAPNFKAVLEISDNSDLLSINSLAGISTAGVADGATLRYEASTQTWKPGPRLDATGVADGATMRYDAATSTWKPGPRIDLTGVVNGSVLKYDTATGTWKVGVDVTGASVSAANTWSAKQNFGAGLESTVAGEGIILVAPNGTRYRVTASNIGAVTAVAI